MKNGKVLFQVQRSYFCFAMPKLVLLSLGTSTGRHSFSLMFKWISVSCPVTGYHWGEPSLWHLSWDTLSFLSMLSDISILWYLENIAVFSTVTKAFNKYSVHLWIRLLNPKVPRHQGMKSAGYKDVLILQPWLASAQNIYISSPFPKPTLFFNKQSVIHIFCVHVVL